MTCTSGLAQASINADVEKWLDSGFVLKVALTRFAGNWTVFIAYMTFGAHSSTLLLQLRFKGEVEVLNRLVPELRIVRRACEFGNHQLMLRVIRMSVNLLCKCV